MASIQIRQRAGGLCSFQVCFRTPDKRETGRTFATREEAEAFLATFPPVRRRTGPTLIPVAERIASMSEIDENGCWIWQGRPTNAGYGAMSIRDNGTVRTRSAHRVSYETHIGPIPEGLTLDHLCRVRMCVNPAHLESVTSRENVLRSPIAQAALNAAKTHCPADHEYTPENTYTYGPHNEWRLCRACQRIHHLAYVAKKGA